MNLNGGRLVRRRREAGEKDSPQSHQPFDNNSQRALANKKNLSKIIKCLPNPSPGSFSAAS